jgi:ubiquinone/menaquinone biosynthesis C-methylase UbiE
VFSKGGPSFRELCDQALSSTEQGYDKLAPKFDKTPFRTPDLIIERSLEELGEVDRSLDLCCGTGAGLLALRRITKKRLVGVDFSAGMLAVAMAELESVVRPVTLELVKKDVLELDYTEEFDLVTCYGAFGHILPEDEPKLVDVIRRSLVPGGRFVFVTGYPPPALSARSLIARAFNAAMHVRNAFVAPQFVMYYLTFLLPDVEALLESYGFGVSVEPAFFPKPFDELVRVVATRR